MSCVRVCVCLSLCISSVFRIGQCCAFTMCFNTHSRQYHSPLFSVLVRAVSIISIYFSSFYIVNKHNGIVLATHSTNNNHKKRTEITDTCKLIKFDNKYKLNRKNERKKTHTSETGLLRSTNDFILIESHELNTTTQDIVRLPPRLLLWLFSWPFNSLYDFFLSSKYELHNYIKL